LMGRRGSKPGRTPSEKAEQVAFAPSRKPFSPMGRGGQLSPNFDGREPSGTAASQGMGGPRGSQSQARLGSGRVGGGGGGWVSGAGVEQPGSAGQGRFPRSRAGVELGPRTSSIPRLACPDSEPGPEEPGCGEELHPPAAKTGGGTGGPTSLSSAIAESEGLDPPEIVDAGLGGED
jgi:hypothetical protein